MTKSPTESKVTNFHILFSSLKILEIEYRQNFSASICTTEKIGLSIQRDETCELSALRLPIFRKDLPHNTLNIPFLFFNNPPLQLTQLSPLPLLLNLEIFSSNLLFLQFSIISQIRLEFQLQDLFILFLINPLLLVIMIQCL